jgi:hypothetical protein
MNHHIYFESLSSDGNINIILEKKVETPTHRNRPTQFFRLDCFENYIKR